MCHPHAALMMAADLTDPCASAPSITGVGAAAAMRACGSGGGVLHTGSMTYSGSMTGFKVEWGYSHDGSGYTTPGTQYTTGADNTEVKHAGTTDVDPAPISPGYEITSCVCRWRCRICLTDGTACSGWTESATSGNGIGNDGDLWDCP